ncbi:MAG: hypothetical protein HeimC2_11670 [Candidatus Heimdallarchaeota archaeon LC_2]|nr:MAG: hypothetical protein HeimC2_11670 [Candidatus Heimdallarchaeota archaeon LC_2]
MHVIDKCKELLKLAKNSEKTNKVDSVELYKQAAKCFEQISKTKEKNSILEKAAIITRELATSSESPITALEYYEQSSQLYNDIGKEKEATKIMKLAYENFINTATKIRIETKKINDLDIAEQRLKLASEYAIKGKNEALSQECWIDLGDKIREVARTIENPREAYEVFQRAIHNYRKAHVETKEFVTLKYTAEKFHKKANEIFNSKKQLASAIDNYNQASIFYSQIKSEDKIQACNKREQEICDIIGISKHSIIEFLDSNRQSSRSIQEIKSPEREKIERELDDPNQDLVLKHFKEVNKLKERAKPHSSEILSENQILPSPAEEISPTSKLENIGHVPSKIEADTKGIQELTREVEKIGKVKSEKQVLNGSVTESKLNQPISDIMENLEEKIKSSEKIKKRIKEEIKKGKPKPKKKKKEDKKKTKEINKLFDKAIDEAMQDFDSRSEEIQSAPKFEKPPKVSTTIVDVQKEKEKIIPEIKSIPKIEKFETEEIKVDSPIDVTENNIEFKVEKPFDPSESDEKYRFSGAVVDVLKEKADFKPTTEKTKTIHKPVETKEKVETRVVDTKIDRPIVPDDVVSKLHDLKPVIGDDRKIIGSSIINILQKQGYIESKFAHEKDLYRVPEYEILSIILNYHPISLENLEEKSKLDSISLVLSNLNADGLIKQTNDYRWTLSQLTLDNLEKPQHDPIQKVDEDDIQKLRARVERNSTLERQFIATMYKFRLIPNREKSLTSLMKIPEFAIIRLIKDNELIELSYIKEEMMNIPPVQVSRILSRLELDGAISKNANDLWELSDKFVKELVGS